MTLSLTLALQQNHAPTLVLTQALDLGSTRAPQVVNLKLALILQYNYALTMVLTQVLDLGPTLDLSLTRAQ